MYQLVQHPERSLGIPPFYGSGRDTELEKLAPFLTIVSTLDDFRPISSYYAKYLSHQLVLREEPISPALKRVRPPKHNRSYSGQATQQVESLRMDSLEITKSDSNESRKLFLPLPDIKLDGRDRFVVRKPKPAEEMSAKLTEPLELTLEEISLLTQNVRKYSMDTQGYRKWDSLDRREEISSQVDPSEVAMEDDEQKTLKGTFEVPKLNVKSQSRAMKQGR